MTIEIDPLVEVCAALLIVRGKHPDDAREWADRIIAMRKVRLPLPSWWMAL